MGDLQPLQCTEIESWFRLTQNDPDPVLIDLILTIDSAYLPSLRGLLGESQSVRSDLEATKRGG